MRRKHGVVMKTDDEVLKEAAEHCEMMDIVTCGVQNYIFVTFGHERPFHQNPATLQAIGKDI